MGEQAAVYLNYFGGGSWEVEMGRGRWNAKLKCKQCSELR